MQTALDPGPSRRRHGSGAPSSASAARRPRHALAAEVFDRLPDGLMVCDRRGRVVATNVRLREIVGDGNAADGLAASCCSLLGCGRPGSPLAAGCMTAHVLAAGAPLPEVRLDGPPWSSAPVWVSAAALDDGTVVFQLRRPRERRPGGGGLRIHALGQVRVEGPDGSIGGDWLAQRPGDLLRFLICRPDHAASADAIAEAIWPRSGPQAATSVRYFVHALRERLEPGRPKRGAPSFVVCRRGTYALDRERVWIDTDEFERRAAAGMSALRAGDHRAAVAELEQAVALYAGDLVAEDPYAEWAVHERERLRSMAGDALRSIARLHADDPAAAAPHLERLAHLEPFDSDVQRDHITALLRLGRRSRAARQYESFRVRLLREFGQRPDFELCALP
jgi:DNA-binding SARP family transcriptional activator